MLGSIKTDLQDDLNVIVPLYAKVYCKNKIPPEVAKMIEPKFESIAKLVDFDFNTILAEGILSEISNMLDKIESGAKLNGLGILSPYDVLNTPTDINLQPIPVTIVNPPQPDMMRRTDPVSAEGPDYDPNPIAVNPQPAMTDKQFRQMDSYIKS
jgi:hypothetical protein